MVHVKRKGSRAKMGRKASMERKRRFKAFGLVLLMTLSCFMIIVSNDAEESDAATTGTVLYGCGQNTGGQQGASNTTDVRTFSMRDSGIIQSVCSMNTTWYITTSGDLYGCGYNSYGQQGVIAPSFITMFNQRASNVAKVACSDETTWYITTSGDLYGCGWNNYGQQGSGDTTNVKTFTQRASNVAQVVSSGNTTWYITTSGDLYGCGSNSSGQQGSGDTTDVTTFTKRASNVAQVVSSGNTTWYITTSGDLYGCGSNSSGQQGSGDTTDVTTFTKRASNVAQVVSSGNTTWYITTSGDLYGCGRNNEGQQGAGNTTNVTTFTKRASNVAQVACSIYTTWYITTSKYLYGCGYNSYYQQGSGNTTNVTTFTQRASNVAQVACSDQTTWYITTSKYLYGCGSNSYYQQGINTNTVKTFTKKSNVTGVSNIICSATTTWFICNVTTITITVSIDQANTGTLSGYGSDNLSSITISDAIPDSNAIIKGPELSLFTAEGKRTIRYTPIDSIEYKRIPNGWSFNGATQSSGTKTITSNMSISPIFTTMNQNYSISIINPYQEDITIETDYVGGLLGCGYNYYGQQGAGNKTNVTTFTQRASNVAQVACSMDTTWYITTSGDLYGCGRNNYGQQGSGDTTDVTTFTKRASNVAQVVCSDYTTWYITTSGDLYGCGYNSYGSQGSGDTPDVTTFTKRASNVAQVVCSDYTTWYITTSGDLYGCGYSAAQGSGDTTNVTTFTKRASNVAQVACSMYTTWYITTSGDLYGCGSNSYGSQGSGDTTSGKTFTQRASNVAQVVCSNYTTWYITTSGDLYGCGYNSTGQQGAGNTTNVTTFTNRASNVAQVACSSNVTWYITTSGDLYGCGYNSYGSQGSGDTTDVTTFTKRASNVAQVTLQQVSTSATSTTWYITTSGDLYGCGYNYYGSQGSGKSGTDYIIYTFTKRASKVAQVVCSHDTTWYVTPALVTEYGTTIEVQDSTIYVGEYSFTPTSTNAQLHITWSGIPNGGVVTGDASISIVILHTVTITTDGSGYGSVSSSTIANVPRGTAVTSSNNTITINGTTVTATPLASTDYVLHRLTYWSGIPVSGTITGDITITANFERIIKYVLDINTAAIGNVTLPNSVSVTDGIYYVSSGNTWPDLGTSAGGYTHQGYTYSGAYHTKGETLPSTNVQITAQSKWVAPTITITYKNTSNEILATISIIPNTTPVLFEPHFSDVYTFTGWFEDIQCTQRFDPTTVLVTDKTLYAGAVEFLYFTTSPVADGQIGYAASLDTFIFDATKSEAAYKVHWDFGDGETSDERICYHSYDKDGTYSVKLTVENLEGETDQMVYSISVGEKPSVIGNLAQDVIIGLVIAIAGFLVLRRFL